MSPAGADRLLDYQDHPELDEALADFNRAVFSLNNAGADDFLEGLNGGGAGLGIGFIGAMTNLHFCESCNKLRLTCEGKLRPCLGSHLEFDIKSPMREGASDEQLRQFFCEVVERKPEQHDFRYNYQPGRRMVAIGG